MKKKLEAELISLAHRILQLKNKEDIAVLQQEARKLYEKLSVLRFVEENFSDAQPTIGRGEVEETIEKGFDYDAKVVVGEIPAEEVPAADEISEMVNNLAASKSVADETQQGPDVDESDENPSGEQTDEVASDETVDGKPSENQSASDGNASETQKVEGETPEENTSENETSEGEISRQNPSSAEASSEVNLLGVTSENPSQEIQESQPSDENPSEKTESPTFENGREFIPADASEEIKMAEEANRATEMFWETKPEDALPAAETNTEAPESSDQDDIFAPKFELSFDDKSAETTESKDDTPAPTFTFDDLLGKDYADPVFVKPEELQSSFETSTPSEPEKQTFNEAKPESPKVEETPAENHKEVIPISRSFDKGNVIPLNKDERGVTLNDRLSKGITIGLNDRIAFMKQLFNNSSEEYNRVLSQLITFDNFTDAKDFIDTMVKPDYDDWKGKEEYEQRFLEIIEKRFQ